MATFAVVVAFSPLNDVISPVPDAAKPIVVLLLVQLKMVLATLLVKLMAFTVELAQTITSLGFVSDGVGLILISLLAVVVPQLLVMASWTV